MQYNSQYLIRASYQKLLACLKQWFITSYVLTDFKLKHRSIIFAANNKSCHLSSYVYGCCRPPIKDVRLTYVSQLKYTSRQPRLDLSTGMQISFLALNYSQIICSISIILCI
jgi:hypothetical protein